MIYQNLNTTKSELIVDFYLNFRCNFDCSYCCSSHDKLRYKEPEYPKSVKIYKEYITNIAKTQYSTCLCLLGGEPECSLCQGNGLCTYPKCTYTEYQGYHKAKAKSLKSALLL